MSPLLCFKWNSHLNVISELKNFLSMGTMVDVTLACDGKSLKAHKIVLSAYSPFFKSLFLENPCKHPIVILKDTKYAELKIIIDFMYCGEVNIAEDQLSAVIKTAQIFRVKGLGDVEFQKGQCSGQTEHLSIDESENPTCNETESQSGEKFDFTRNDDMHVMNEFKNFLSTEAMVDVTLGCDGQSLKAHKIILSAYSSLFRSLFLENPCKHPIVILKDMKYSELKSIINFMYCSEFKIANGQLSALIKTAKILKVKIPSEMESQNTQSSDESGNLINGQAENESADELSQPLCMVDVSKWTIMQKQSSSFQNENLGHAAEIKQENVSNDTNFNVSYINKSSVTFPFYESNHFVKSEPVDENYDEEENENLGHAAEIKQENVSNDTNFNVSYINKSSVPSPSNESNHFVKTEPVEENYDEDIAVEKSFEGSSQNRKLRQILLADDLQTQSLQSCVESNIELHEEFTNTLVPVSSAGTSIVDSQEPETSSGSTIVNSDEACLQNVESCGCRKNCLSKFTGEERQLLSIHHKSMKPKMKQALYFLSLMSFKKIVKRTYENEMKLVYKYIYKIKIGSKELYVCMRGFLILHNIPMSMLTDLQLVLKMDMYDKYGLADVVYPYVNNAEEHEVQFTDMLPINDTESENNSTASKSSKTSYSGHKSMKMKKLSSMKIKDSTTKRTCSMRKRPKCFSLVKNSATKKSGSVRKKLRDFPSVVKSLDEVDESLLRDLHSLLFSSTADNSDKMKDNILDFDGFKFSTDSKEFEERRDFLQSMSYKELRYISSAFSLPIKNTKERKMQHILLFLLKPDESFLRSPVKVPATKKDDNVRKMSRDLTLVKDSATKKNCSMRKMPKFSLDQRIRRRSLELLFTEPETKKDDNVRKKLRDFPLVVKSLNQVAETLLIDLHFLLFSSTADSDKVKDSILDFDGFKFSTDSEEHDERKDFLEGMSNKLLTDVARALSICVKSNKEENIQNILLFLLKPHESFLTASDPRTKKDDLRKKLRDFPLVIKSLDEVAETLLIDLHFLLFSTSADSGKAKDNILDFDGFKFGADSEEYDEKNDFLQRMSGKLLTDVAKAFSIDVMNNRKETIQNILLFLLKPDEQYLTASVSSPLILSDEELDDMEEMSDSDDSITMQVVEKQIEYIDLEL